jgi:hypothetical protein
MRRYVDLATALRALDAVKLEYRPDKWMFGSVNYGEVYGNLYNPADGDRYDVFAPGYASRLPTNRVYRVRGVLGVLEMENGNHKIAVRLDEPGYDAARARAEIHRYCHEYTRRMRRQGVWHEGSPPLGHAPSTVAMLERGASPLRRNPMRPGSSHRSTARSRPRPT